MVVWRYYLLIKNMATAYVSLRSCVENAKYAEFALTEIMHRNEPLNSEMIIL
jgi:hypothetical protein